jgi:hypothetical protein
MQVLLQFFYVSLHVALITARTRTVTQECPSLLNQVVSAWVPYITVSKSAQVFWPQGNQKSSEQVHKFHSPIPSKCFLSFICTNFTASWEQDFQSRSVRGLLLTTSSVLQWKASPAVCQNELS